MQVDIDRLVVKLGGLCMLVYRPAEPGGVREGLFVLMPKGHGHCPLFVCEAQHGGGRIQHLLLQLVQPSDEIDLRNIADFGPKEPLPDFVANLSRFYSGGRPVDERCFDGGARSGLDARIILPFPESGMIQSEGELAEFEVPNGNTGGLDRADLSGLCTIEYVVRSGHGWDGKIGNIQLTPVDRSITLYFVNVRPQDLKGQTYFHQKGDPWDHPQAYHRILKGNVDPTGPAAIFAKTVQGKIDDHTPHSCKGIVITDWPPLVAGFVDPYSCTLGGGCGPNDPAC